MIRQNVGHCSLDKKYSERVPVDGVTLRDLVIAECMLKVLNENQFSPEKRCGCVRAID